MARWGLDPFTRPEMPGDTRLRRHVEEIAPKSRQFTDPHRCPTPRPVPAGACGTARNLPSQGPAPMSHFPALNHTGPAASRAVAQPCPHLPRDCCACSATAPSPHLRCGFHNTAGAAHTQPDTYPGRRVTDAPADPFTNLKKTRISAGAAKTGGGRVRTGRRRSHEDWRARATTILAFLTLMWQTRHGGFTVEPPCRAPRPKPATSLDG